VIYAMRAQLKAMPFSVQTTIDTGGNQTKIMVDIESLQRILVVSSGISMKMVDGQCYEKTSGNSWHACTDPKTEASVVASYGSMLLDESVINAIIDMIQTVKLIGTEILNGIPARIYEYTFAGDLSGVHTEGTSRLWVAEDDGLPIKQVTTGTSGGYSATTTQSIDYNPTLTVRAP
jgi:hypothetical protein